MIKLALTASISLITISGCKSTRSQNAGVKDVLVSDLNSNVGFDIMYFKKNFICLATCSETYHGEFLAKIVQETDDRIKSGAARAMCSGQARQMSKAEFDAFLLQQQSNNIDATSVALVRGAMLGAAGAVVVNLNPNNNSPATQVTYSPLVANLYDYMKQNAAPSTGPCGPANDGALAPQNMPAVAVSAVPVSNQSTGAPSGSTDMNNAQNGQNGNGPMMLRSGRYTISDKTNDPKWTGELFIRSIPSESKLHIAWGKIDVLPYSSVTYHCNSKGRCKDENGYHIQIAEPDSFLKFDHEWDEKIPFHLIDDLPNSLPTSFDTDAYDSAYIRCDDTDC